MRELTTAEMAAISGGGEAPTITPGDVVGLLVGLTGGEVFGGPIGGAVAGLAVGKYIDYVIYTSSDITPMGNLPWGMGTPDGRRDDHGRPWYDNH